MPLSDNDPEVVKKCIEGLNTSMHNAHDLDAGAVLLVPGIVTAADRYAQAVRRTLQSAKEGARPGSPG